MLAELVATTLAATAQRADAVSFAFVDDATMSACHEQYVDIAKITDVLSFPAGAAFAGDAAFPADAALSADAAFAGAERDLGDVMICTDQARRQAAAAGRSYGRELEILALHGLLHLLGYDHERDDGEMARLEARLRPLVVGRR